MSSPDDGSACQEGLAINCHSGNLDSAGQASLRVVILGVVFD